MAIRRIIGLGIAGMTATMVVGAVGALSTKRRLVPTTDESADEIVAVAIFGPLTFHSTSQHFQGGSLDCWYGGGVLDLRDAILAPEGATLRVRAIFGGGQILVPATWKVVTNVRGVGGVTDTRPAPWSADDGPELRIDGIVFCGGFAATSELEEREAEWLQGMATKQGRRGSGEYAAETAGDAMSEPGPTSEPEMAPAG